MREFKYWTCTQRRRAIEMAGQGMPYAEIAKTLGRSPLAVRSLMGRLARSGDVKGRYKHLEDLDRTKMHPVIRRLVEVAVKDGYTVDILAERSGMSRNAIRKMIKVGNPHFNTLLTVAQTLNVRLTATQIQDGAQ